MPALTRRQLEVCVLLVDGYRQSEVARMLGVTPSTVSSHLFDARERLGVRGGTAALMVEIGARGLLNGERVGYSTWLQSTRHDLAWQPPPAQRLYLDAFTLALWRRDVLALYRMELALRLMLAEAGVPVRPRPSFDAERAAVQLDAMLLRVGRGVLRRIPA